MPASWMQRATPAGARSTFTPSCSRTSAEPHRDEAARLPCLATRAPHAAATIAASVEMLNVARPSPPVPQVSRSAPSTWIGVAIALAVFAKPVISSTVSPLMRSATTKPAIWDGVASPRMITSNADAASSSVRFSHLMSFAIASIIPTPCSLPMNGEGAIATSSCVHLHRPTDKVAQDFLAFLGQHRLGMELHAVGRVPDVAQSHDHSVVCPRRDDEVRWDARPFDDQRVVARRLERLAHAGQHARVVVVDP